MKYMQLMIPPYSWGVYSHSPFFSFYFHLPIHCVLSFQLFYFICMLYYLIYLLCLLLYRFWTKHWRCCCWYLCEFNCNSLKLRITVICFRYRKWANYLSVEFYSGCFIDWSLKAKRLKHTKRLDHDSILCLYIMSFYKTAMSFNTNSHSEG